MSSVDFLENNAGKIKKHFSLRLFSLMSFAKVLPIHLVNVEAREVPSVQYVA